MFRFTIRDVLWLTVVVAMGLGWTCHVRAIRGEILTLNRMMKECIENGKRYLELIRELEKAQANTTQKSSPDQKEKIIPPKATAMRRGVAEKLANAVPRLSGSCVWLP